MILVQIFLKQTTGAIKKVKKKIKENRNKLDSILLYHYLTFRSRRRDPAYNGQVAISGPSETGFPSIILRIKWLIGFKNTINYSGQMIHTGNNGNVFGLSF